MLKVTENRVISVRTPNVTKESIENTMTGHSVMDHLWRPAIG